MEALKIDEYTEDEYTVDDILALPEGERAELIDGRWYDMASPTGTHQAIITAILGELRNYIRSKGGKCKVFPAPYAVFLNNDDRTYVEPDVVVICDEQKMDDKGCHGAPDLVVEVASPSTSKRDYGLKLFKYRTAGVKEYWIVNPDKKTINTYFFIPNGGEEGNQVTFDEEIPCGLFQDFHMILSEAL
ncbi:MAG: Uma2 family endonuclease [Lachnospiraceae bacterium]|nr:Uma2 family endonuclease [Lachnospiraceae bacterium]